MAESTANGIPEELRQYLAVCVLAARPSRSRSAALRALGAASDTAADGIEWDELEAEARRQGWTVADIVFDRAGRPPYPHR